MNIHPYEKHEVILKAENVSLRLGDNQILRDINIDIKNIVRPGMSQGQIIGLLGSSGVGKTKFFELLSGITSFDYIQSPTKEVGDKMDRLATGSVKIGVDLSPVTIGKVGVIQQTYPLFEHRTIYGNLEIAAKVKFKNKSEREDRINDLLTRFDLMGKKKHYPAQLSGGQKQRVAIAQQIICSNNFLLMDEPFSGLDPNMVKKVSHLIVEVANMHELNTIIIVSHDIISTTAIADTLWVMGRDRNEKNEIIPGAKIKYEYDLIERNLAWHPDIKRMPEFHDLCYELESLFSNL
jgi:polar amino acid transport system ATP-binding protein/sulfate transport system ATP-binding protein